VIKSHLPPRHKRRPHRGVRVLWAVATASRSSSRCASPIPCYARRVLLFSRPTDGGMTVHCDATVTTCLENEGTRQMAAHAPARDHPYHYEVAATAQSDAQDETEGRWMSGTRRHKLVVKNKNGTTSVGRGALQAFALCMHICDNRQSIPRVPPDLSSNVTIRPRIAKPSSA
jgi:hypothetical protein